MGIKLLPVSVDSPRSTELSAESTSLVLAKRPAIISTTGAGGDTAYPIDRFIWSASARDNGSFQFYAIPLQNYQSDSSSSRNNDSSASYRLDFGWNSLSRSNVIAQYQLLASMPIPPSGKLVDVYA